jgi:hypothetical protein
VSRRKFPQPEQSANGVSDKELMQALDCEESEEKMQMDTKHPHEKHIMTVINAACSHHFDMPFNAFYHQTQRFCYRLKQCNT